MSELRGRGESGRTSGLVGSRDQIMQSYHMKSRRLTAQEEKEGVKERAWNQGKERSDSV